MATFFNYKWCSSMHTSSGTSIISYNGTSLLQPPTGLGKSNLNDKVTVILEQSMLFTMGNHLELSKGGHNGEVTILVR